MSLNHTGSTHRDAPSTTTVLLFSLVLCLLLYAFFGSSTRLPF